MAASTRGLGFVQDVDDASAKHQSECKRSQRRSIKQRFKENKRMKEVAWTQQAWAQHGRSEQACIAYPATLHMALTRSSVPLSLLSLPSHNMPCSFCPNSPLPPHSILLALDIHLYKSFWHYTYTHTNPWHYTYSYQSLVYHAPHLKAAAPHVFLNRVAATAFPAANLHTAMPHDLAPAPTCCFVPTSNIDQ